MKPLFSLRLLALLCFLLAGPGAWAQAPAWQSALLVGAGQTVSSYSYVTATAADASGNIYVAGSFGGTVRFGSTTLTSAGLHDMFVAKVQALTQQFLWVQQAGGTGSDRANALAVSGTSVYVTGHFYATASFGSTSLSSVGNEDVFVAKLTDAGSTASFAWAQRAGSSDGDYTTALAVSGTSVYVAGAFSSPTASFGSMSLTSAGSTDVFVAKLTDTGSTGSFTWVQRAGGTGDDHATALAVSGTSVFVTGTFRSSTTGFGSTSLANAGQEDVFVAKLTDAGSTASFTWAHRAGGTGSDEAFALAVSGTSVYVAGNFDSSTAGFGSTSLASAGRNDVFVSKLTDAGSTGSFTWAQRAGSSDFDFANTLAVSGTSVYVAGWFYGTASFGSMSLTSAGAYDVFVAQLTDAGSTASFAWAQRAGGTAGDRADALAVSGMSVYVAGEFASPTAGFGPTTLGGSTTPSLGYSFGFLAALTDLTLTATTPALAGAGVDLFPNPAQGTATLVLPAGLGAAEATLTLADALGRVVRTQALTVPTAGRRYALDLRGLTPGVYALRVQAGAGAVVRRLVVE